MEPNPPLKLWAQDVAYLDWYSINLPTHVQLRDVHFVVGLYHAGTGQRLPISAVAKGQALDDGFVIK